MDGVLFPMFPNWQACYEAYLQTVLDKSGSVSSEKSYRSILLLFFGASPQKHPASYTRADVLAFLQQPSQSLRCLGRPLAANSKNCRVSALRGFYRFASEYDIAQADGSLAPLFSRPLPTRGVGYLARDRHAQGFSLDELERFFSVMDTSTIRGCRDRALFLLFFYCGKRRMEVLRLTWGDISQGTVIDRDGTHRQAYLFRYVRKGHARETSTAELPHEAYSALIHYLSMSGRLASMTVTSPLFVALRAGSGRHERSESEPLAPSSVAMIFHNYLHQCGLADRGYGLHALRHASAAARYELGSDIKSIQSTLDHASLLTTSLYLDSLIRQGDEGAKLLEKRFAHLTPH